MRRLGDLGEHLARHVPSSQGASRSRHSPASRRASVSSCSASRVARSQPAITCSSACRAASSLRAPARDLRLRADRGQRRAQLVRGVGGEGAFALERRGDAREELVQRVDQRAHLARHALRGDRRRGAAGRARPTAPASALQRRERAPDREQQPDAEQRQRDEQRREQMPAICARDGVARVGAFGHLHEHATLERPGAEDAPAHAVDAARR